LQEANDPLPTCYFAESRSRLPSFGLKLHAASERANEPVLSGWKYSLAKLLELVCEVDLAEEDGCFVWIKKLCKKQED